MKAEDAGYARYRLARAGESLDEAQVLLDNNHLNGAVNRLYYACFYAVSALLLTEGRSSSKHSGVRSLFDQHWVNAGRIPAELGRLYRQLFQRRQRSDYGDLVTFERAEVEKLREEAGEFVKVVSAQAEQMISEAQQDDKTC